MIRPTLLFALTLTAAFAQHFDVAAIKPNTDGDNQFMFMGKPGGYLDASGVTVKFLIMEAYKLRAFQVSGGPSWIGLDRWDIKAKADGIEGRLSRDQLQAMVGSLLEDRFALKFHRETKEMPVYELVVAKKGQKLTPHPEGTPGKGANMGPGRFSVSKGTMALLVRNLSMETGRVVLDQTGLTGEYDFTLEYSPDSHQGPEVMGLPPGPPKQPAAGTNAPSIFTALQQQLGLKLEPAKGPVEILVIDRVEKPTAN